MEVRTSQEALVPATGRPSSVRDVRERSFGPQGLVPRQATFSRLDHLTHLSILRVPVAPRSGADVGREVLAGEGGAGGDEVGGCALEDDPAAVVAGAGT